MYSRARARFSCVRTAMGDATEPPGLRGLQSSRLAQGGEQSLRGQEIIAGMLLRVRGAAHRYLHGQRRAVRKLGQQIAQWQGAVAGRQATGSGLFDERFRRSRPLCHGITQLRAANESCGSRPQVHGAASAAREVEGIDQQAAVGPISGAHNVERIREACDRAPCHTFEIDTQRVLRRQIAQARRRARSGQRPGRPAPECLRR